MTPSKVQSLAARVATDPYFLALVLDYFVKSEGLSDADLASSLGCTLDALAALRLCRRPRQEPQLFQADVEQIAGRFGIDADVLAQLIRRSDVITSMKETAKDHSGLLMAARDKVDSQSPSGKSRDEDD